MTTPSVSDAVQSMAKLFEGKSREEQKELLAALERAGAAVYRALSANEPDAVAAKALLACAEREEQNAEALELSP
jgi:Holliday junction resolvase